VTEPIGVSSEYGIEIYFPSVINHSFASNYPDEEAEDEDVEGEDEEGDEGELEESEGEDLAEGEQPPDDDYYRKLTQRP
jgi:hypothetical protein